MNGAKRLIGIYMFKLRSLEMNKNNIESIFENLESKLDSR
jgi:hypothetical protein